jgi:proteasome accessory factor A
LRLFAFKEIRSDAMAFFVSRATFSGAGSVEPDGRFSLSEKGAAIHRVLRLSMSPAERPIFDTGNLMRPAFAAAHFHLEPVAQLFAREQRLQLGLADSSMLEEAEFLKMGATALVIDMAEAGFLADAPRVDDPVGALHAFVADPALEVAVATRGGERTALELQRYYVDKAKAFVKGSKATSLEASEVIELWDDVLTALERRNMSALVGRIDWVTKRYLLEACGDEGDRAMLKTIDLRYHELGDGYAEQYAKTGGVHRLLEPVEVERAIVEPPEGTPAYTRGRFIRSRAPHLTPVRISWRSALIGGRIKGKVIRFPERGE